MKKVFIMVFIIAVVVALVLGGCTSTPATTSAAPQTIKIGAIWGLTGPFSAGEVPMGKGEAICKDWINSNGGITINGQKYVISTIDEDNTSAANAAVTAAQKLVFQEKVQFVIGDVVPFTIEAARSITDPAKVMYLSSQYDVPSPQYPYTLSAFFPYWSTKSILYDYLVKAYPNVKTVAMSNQDEPGNARAGDRAVTEIQAHGLQLIDREVYPLGTSDHLPLMTKLVGTHADAIDINLESNNGAAEMVKDARQLGYTGPILYDSTTDPKTIASMIGNNAYATDFILPSFDPTSPDVNIPMLTTIIKLWNDAYHVPFVIDALRGWDPLYVLVQSIQKAQSLDSATVVKAFENMGTVETAEGTARIGGMQTFGLNGTVVQKSGLTRLMNGNTEFIGWFQPDVP